MFLVKSWLRQTDWRAFLDRIFIHWSWRRFDCLNNLSKVFLFFLNEQNIVISESLSQHDCFLHLILIGLNSHLRDIIPGSFHRPKCKSVQYLFFINGFLFIFFMTFSRINLFKKETLETLDEDSKLVSKFYWIKILLFISSECSIFSLVFCTSIKSLVGIETVLLLRSFENDIIVLRKLRSLAVTVESKRLSSSNGFLEKFVEVL